MNALTQGKMELAIRVQSAEPSATLAIAAKAKELKEKGIDVISLSAGEPDFDTPGFIKEAAVSALQNGVTKYTPATGTLDLRQAIARKLKRDQNLEIPPSNIIVSSGAKHAIFNVLFALVNEGDEVLIPSPYWLSYPAMVTFLGGKNVFIRTDEGTEFKITPEGLKKAITPKTKVLILNSPSNPTGAVYSSEELSALVKVLKDYPRLVILSDEIYEKLLFDGRKHVSIAQLDPEIAARTVIVNGHSKAYAMTGWRLGYCACLSKELAEAIASMQSHTTSNPTSFAQPGGLVALDRGDEDARRMSCAYEKRRDLFLDLLAGIPRLKAFRPQGAFYIFANIKDTGLDCVRVTKSLLEEAHVAIVPGDAFGSQDHIRMSFATSEAQLCGAASRLRDWFSKL